MITSDKCFAPVIERCWNRGSQVIKLFQWKCYAACDFPFSRRGCGIPAKVSSQHSSTCLGRSSCFTFKILSISCIYSGNECIFPHKTLCSIFSSQSDYLAETKGDSACRNVLLNSFQYVIVLLSNGDNSHNVRWKYNMELLILLIQSSDFSNIVLEFETPKVR